MSKKILVKLIFKYFLNEIKKEIIDKLISFIINQGLELLDQIQQNIQQILS